MMVSSFVIIFICLFVFKPYHLFTRLDQDNDNDDRDFDDDYLYSMSQPNPNIDTNRIDEVPAKEPKFNAVPLKSALKKKGSNSGPGTPTQENNGRTLGNRHDNNSSSSTK